jgi:type II secretory pathway predicted ATPase ExeA
MYVEYYHSNTVPSQLTPECQFLFESEEHKRAIFDLTYGLALEEGFIVINGEIGPGNTMLVERLGSELDNFLGLKVLLARDLDKAHCIRGSMVNDVAEELARDLVAGRLSPQNGLTKVAISGQSSDQNIAAREHVVSRHDRIVKRALAIAVELFGARK